MHNTIAHKPYIATSALHKLCMVEAPCGGNIGLGLLKGNSVMHKFTLRYASHTIPVLSPMFLYSPFRNFHLLVCLPFYTMHACMNQVCLLFLFTSL